MLILGGAALVAISLIVPIAFTVFALIDALNHNFREPKRKAIWVLVIVVLPVIDPLLYASIGRDQ